MRHRDVASSSIELLLVLCGAAVMSLSLVLATGAGQLVEVLAGLGILWAAFSCRFWRRSAREYEALFRWAAGLDKPAPVPGVVIPPDDHVL